MGCCDFRGKRKEKAKAAYGQWVWKDGTAVRKGMKNTLGQLEEESKRGKRSVIQICITRLMIIPFTELEK